MASYHQTTQFFGVLEIYVHQARNIHNICIYDDQDVYAKFSLTYNPDETFSTRVINGGGKNPEFNQKLAIKIDHFDAVLKCEMWMLSRVKSFMEDQLLGFSLVPVSMIGTGVLTKDFSLSSTDLFHSPAGTVRLSLSLNTNSQSDRTIGLTNLNTGSSITSEVVLLDPNHPIECSGIEFPDVNKRSQYNPTYSKQNQQMDYSRVEFPDNNVVSENQQMEYSKIEFPDINVVTENQQMVSEYFGWSGRNDTTGPGPFLCLGASILDAPNESIRASNNSPKKSSLPGESSSGVRDVKEESEMQQQIVDMYMRSMQQSLANMKLPVNLEKINIVGDVGRDVIQQPENTVEMTEKKNGGRVFYGSRAFF